MKKVLFILSILVMGLVLVSCDGDEPEVVDGAIAKLQTAYDGLNGVISDPNNITGNINLPTALANSVVATWESDEPGVVSIGEAVSGIAIATVNRPEMGAGDATVVLTATLSLQSELTTDVLTQTWTVTLTVKENTVATITIDTVADILAITDSSYDGTYQVTIENLSVFAKGDDAAFAYDGTGTIEVYGGASADMEVGKVYTVSGTIDWYYGLWEITGSTATEQTGATYQEPTQAAITDVEAYLAALTTAGENANATVADGSLEPIYATVTGKVYVIPGDTSNYNTYIIGSTASTLTLGASGVPATGFMVYYHTYNLDDLRLYDGIEVTIDVVIYTYRSNNNAYAIYYVGGADGITANLTDAEKQAIDGGALSVPASTTEAITLDLPTAGNNGSTIVWSYTDANATAANAYVDLTTGAVTVPTGEQVTVGLTATVSFTGLDDLVLTFTIKVGEYPLSTVAEAILAGDAAIVRVVGIVTDTTDAAGYGAFWLQDATAGIDLFNKNAVFTTDDIGKTFEIIAEVDLYNGLWELVVASRDNITELTGDAALSMPTATDISALTLDSATLLPLQGQLVDFTGFVLSAAVADTPTASFNMYFVNDAGQSITVRLDKDVPGFADFVTTVSAAAAGTAFDFTDLIVGWYNGAQLLVGSSSTIVAGTAYTNQELLDAAAALLAAPEANAEVTANLTLPTTGLFGSTVAWTSSNTDVIATDGTVTRPANGAGNATVTLSFVVTLADLSTTAVEIQFTVLEETGIPFVAPNVFISEYIEGSSNNKAIEIYNGTGAEIDLSKYTVEVYTNGSATVVYTLTLSGTLAAGDVYVIYNSSANDAIKAVGDISSNVTYYNGDDAVALLFETTIIDLIGVIGVDPGSSWTVGTGATGEYTLVRDASVTGPNATFTETEWVVYAQDTTDYLGSHTVS